MNSAYRDPAAARIYRRIAMPAQFTQPARDLVALMRILPGHNVLDVGTGTGAFLNRALEAAAPSSVVMGVDPSMEMMTELLRALPVRGVQRLVAGETPGLPFRDGTFDAVGASFVIPHCRDHVAALADMVRVCRPGGRVGMTTWGAQQNAASKLWTEVAATFVAEERMRQVFHGVLPRQEWFSLIDNIERVLDRAGLTEVQVETRDYAIEMTPRDYLAMKLAGTDGAVIRHLVTETDWNDFRQRVEEAFRERFPGPLEFVRDVHFGVGTRP